MLIADFLCVCMHLKSGKNSAMPVDFYFFIFFRKMTLPINAEGRRKVKERTEMNASQLPQPEAVSKWGETAGAGSDDVNFKPAPNYLSSPRPTACVWPFLLRAFTK